MTTPREDAIAAYNAQYGLPPTACNCHHGSARMCPVHTQADYDAASRTTPRDDAIAAIEDVLGDALDGYGDPHAWAVIIADRLSALGAEAETPDRCSCDCDECFIDAERYRREAVAAYLASPETAEALRSAYDEVTESMSPGEAGFFAAILAAMRGT